VCNLGCAHGCVAAVPATVATHLSTFWTTCLKTCAVQLFAARMLLICRGCQVQLPCLGEHNTMWFEYNPVHELVRLRLLRVRYTQGSSTLSFDRMCDSDTQMRRTGPAGSVFLICSSFSPHLLDAPSGWGTQRIEALDAYHCSNSCRPSRSGRPVCRPLLVVPDVGEAQVWRRVQPSN
jgi:hypothetical protein